MYYADHTNSAFTAKNRVIVLLVELSMACRMHQILQFSSSMCNLVSPVSMVGQQKVRAPSAHTNNTSFKQQATCSQSSISLPIKITCTSRLNSEQTNMSFQVYTNLRKTGKKQSNQGNRLVDTDCWVSSHDSRVMLTSKMQKFYHFIMQKCCIIYY